MQKKKKLLKERKRGLERYCSLSVGKEIELGGLSPCG
jgi:hypothetical protein